MLRTVNNIEDYVISATDGNIGHIKVKRIQHKGPVLINIFTVPNASVRKH
ncbi:hypothetical protein [Shewanella sp. SR44-4]|jgi:hypothetical protein|nr:hypothetical protein [Shewanella sp. SR44-4]